MTAGGAWNPLRGRRDRFVMAVAGVVGLASLAALVAIYRASAPTLGLYLVPAAAFAAIGFLWALHCPPQPEGGDDAGDPRAFTVLVAALIGLCALALATTRGMGEWKPLAFYVSYAAAIAVLVAQALVAPPRSRLALAVALAEASALLALFTLATQVPTLVLAGADTQFHRLAIQRAAEAGSTAIITAPYNLFSGYHALPILLVQAGLSIKVAVIITQIVLAVALVVATGLVAARAFDERAAIVAVALLAASPGIVSMVSSISPSKAGVWALLAAVYCLFTRSRGAYLLVALFVLTAFLYHPVLGAAALVLFAPALLFFEYLPGASWMASLGRRIGLHDPARAPPARAASKFRIYAPLLIFAVIVAGAAAWIFLRSPRLAAIMLSPFTHAGNQEGALGVVRVPTLTGRFLIETLWVNLTDLWLLAAAAFVIVAVLLGAWRREAALLSAMLVSLLAMVAAIIGAGLFLAGPERFIALQGVLTVTLAAPAVLLVLGQFRRRSAVGRSTRAQLFAFAALGLLIFGQASSYRGDGDAALAPDVPKQSDVLTPQIVAMVQALQPHLKGTDALSMDYTTMFHGANFPSHNEFTLWNAPVSRFATNASDGAQVRHGDVFTWSRLAADRSVQREAWERTSLVDDVLYDNGDVVAGIA